MLDGRQGGTLRVLRQMYSIWSQVYAETLKLFSEIMSGRRPSPRARPELHTSASARD